MRSTLVSSGFLLIGSGRNWHLGVLDESPQDEAFELVEFAMRRVAAGDIQFAQSGYALLPAHGVPLSSGVVPFGSHRLGHVGLIRSAVRSRENTHKAAALPST